jgi:LysR family transcriptional regulator, hydrogen peroxide-inducible genes activator
MRFTLRQLEFAVATAKHLSFSEAARRTFVSQPALSAQIAQLETALGGPLFERTSKRVSLTPFGAAFVARAAKALQELQALEGLAEARRKPLVGDLRLGVIPTVAPYLVPRVVEAMRRRYPQCRLLLAEDQTRRLVRRAEDGELDVLLLALEADLGRLATRALFADPFVAAVPAAHPLAAKSRVTIDDLLAENLLLLEDGHCLATQVRVACGAPAGELGDFRAGSLGTLVQMVALGHGVTLLPDLARDALAGPSSQVAARPLAPGAARTIGLAWREHHPRAPEFALLADLIAGPAPEPGASKSPAARGPKKRRGS